ncbi:acyl carrier protein [Hydrogenimonas sp.]
MKERIEKIIVEALEDINDDLESEALENPTAETRLFGDGGALDSLALVSVITDIEEAVHEEFDKHITIADEKAMSMKHSPFSTVGTLTDYVESLLNAS